jgi:hypothetical protein
VNMDLELAKRVESYLGNEPVNISIDSVPSSLQGGLVAVTTICFLLVLAVSLMRTWTRSSILKERFGLEDVFMAVAVVSMRIRLYDLTV